MAKKTTYLYKVRVWRGSGLSQTEYVYARNQATAIDGVKAMHKDMKCDHAEAVCFAEADFGMHPDVFKPLTPEEVKDVTDAGIAKADAYARRKDVGFVMPEGAEFVPVAKE